MKIPDRPIGKTNVDIVELNGQQHFILANLFSKWPEISRLYNLAKMSSHT